MEEISMTERYYEKYIKAMILSYFSLLLFPIGLVVTSYLKSETYLFFIIFFAITVFVFAYVRSCFYLYKMFHGKFRLSVVFFRAFNIFTVRIMKNIVIKKEKDPSYNPESTVEKIYYRFYIR